MSCKVENTTINDVAYSCTQYPAVEALTFKLKVIKVLGPAIGSIIPALSKSDDEDNSTNQLSALTNGIEKLFESASPEEIIKLMVDMLTTGHTKRDGKRLTESLFNEVYSGDNLSEAYKAFIWVLRVNYSAFFKGKGATDLLAKMEGKL